LIVKQTAAELAIELDDKATQECIRISDGLQEQLDRVS